LRGVVAEARAKLNLCLAVGPRRTDGYHDLVTLFQSVSLSDTLVVEPRPRGFSLAVRSERSAVRNAKPKTREPRPPLGSGNLVLRAARLLSRRSGLEAGARFTLIKRIPMRAGLGGGSADAAAAIAGLSALYGLELSTPERLALALELGSDVPFAVLGGTALGAGRGERLEPLELARPFRGLIAVPQWRISTALAYEKMDRRKYFLTPWKAKLRSAQVLGRKRLRAEVWLNLGNSFEEVLGRRRADFLSLCERFREAGVNHVRMTGSGSAVFGVIEPGVSAERVAGRFSGSETLYIVRSTRTGLRLKPLQ
jgi:4-diphosphocytidyl-2-C-methyl-D-erythritol kinase